jgi:cytochrome c5
MKIFLILIISLVGFNAQATSLKRECSTAFGEQVYPAFCSGCHDALPREMIPKFQLGDRLDKADAELLDTILNGKGMMPPWKSQEWTDNELNEIICYLRSLQEL